MIKIITIAEVIVALILIFSILLQNRGAGLSGAFGGDFGGYYTRRGFERFLVIFSIILAALFIILAVSAVILSRKAAL